MEKNLRFTIVVPMISFLLLLITSSPAYAQTKEEEHGDAIKSTAKVAEEKEETNTPSKTVTDFCSQRRTTEDRAFCIRVFKLNPISASAQNNIALLKISIDLTVSNAKRTKGFLKTLLLNDGEKSAAGAAAAVLKPVVEECISAYEDSIKQLEMVISKDLEDDPPMSSFDAKMANQQLSRCQNSLSISKIPQGQLIAARNLISTAYGKLVEEISNTI